jgi:hypothetical protein
MADDPIKKMLSDLAETLSSEYNDTIYRIVSSLQHAGVPKAEVEAVMDKVPDIAGPFMGDDSENNLKMLDLVFIGLLVHDFRSHFIEEREEADG